ncbi:unnamed protein product [Fraxinus pennsylvanica]|uniref:Uncharacterized protein n=1 Tax=Fraxinus pennsylvanica TaxID=56036 RepID=A0AAD2E347_9LAMI|nr:unnamed protein product [Fraxinus pennsylvanica]
MEGRIEGFSSERDLRGASMFLLLLSNPGDERPSYDMRSFLKFCVNSSNSTVHSHNFIVQTPNCVNVVILNISLSKYIMEASFMISQTMWCTKGDLFCSSTSFMVNGAPERICARKELTKLESEEDIKGMLRDMDGHPDVKIYFAVQMQSYALSLHPWSSQVDEDQTFDDCYVPSIAENEGREPEGNWPDQFFIFEENADELWSQYDETLQYHNEEDTNIVIVDLPVSLQAQLMANTSRLYLTCIRNTLEAAMCLQNFPCQEVERHNKPEVELKYVICVYAHPC